MKKLELVEAFATQMEMSKSDAKKAIEVLESIIKSVQELGDTKESVKFADATFGCKEVKGRSGVTKMPGKPEVEWSTDDHMEGSVKASASMKKMFE